jgi:hypothetical protein
MESKFHLKPRILFIIEPTMSAIENTNLDLCGELEKHILQ